MNKEDVKTKEDLIQYLNSIPDGLPFVEELWETCVKKAEEDKLKEDPVRSITSVEPDGTVIERKQKAGVKITDPVKWYFRLQSLPQNRKKAIELKEKLEIDSGSKQEIMDTYFDEEDNTHEFNEILDWIDMFPNANERQYLKQKYTSYYDTYEINDGADRISLSRILSLEIELYRINIKRAQGKAIDISKEEKLTKMLRETLESMKWTKKQRSMTDEMAQNKFTIFMDKQVKNGKFTPEHHEIPKDEIDMLLEIIPEAIRKMFD